MDSILKISIDLVEICIDPYGGRTISRETDEPQIIIIDRYINDEICIYDLLSLSGIEFDCLGERLFFSKGVFKSHFSEDKECRCEEVSKKNCLIIKYRIGNNSEYEQVPLEFVAFLLNNADVPFYIEGENIYI